jgi:hypothetical protein
MRCPSCGGEAKEVSGAWKCACGHAWRKAKFDGLTAEQKALALQAEGRRELAKLEERRKPEWPR